MAAVALCGARVHVDDALVNGVAVVLRDGRIEAVLPETELPVDVERRPLPGGVLAAGFIDTQVNGGGGKLFNASPDVESLRIIAAAHRRYGTTGFLPTLISDDIPTIERALQAVDDAIAEGVPGVLGIHIEGPMLAPTRHGIHDERFFRTPDHDLLTLLRSPRLGRTLITLAPEVVGAAVISELAHAGIVVSAGHTEATYDEMTAGFAAGVRGVTHLFNAMSALTSRAPGSVGAALDDQSVWCGIIVDGVHVDPAVLRIALRSRPINRFMLVTDAMTPVGTDAVGFMLQGKEIRVEGNRCVDEEGTLAGSNLTMAGAVRNCVDLLTLPLHSALDLASAAPAEFLGMYRSRGRIAEGLAADLVWLDAQGKVGGTWIAGAESMVGEA